MRKYLFLLTFLISVKINSQEITPQPILREYDFGKAWFYNDGTNTIGTLSKDYHDFGVVYKDSIYFRTGGNFDQFQIRKILESNDLNYIDLSNSKINILGIGSDFSNDTLTTFSKLLTLHNNTITEIFHMSNSKIKNFLSMQNNKFKVSFFSILNVQLNSRSWILNNEFNGLSDFIGILSKEEFLFGSNKFNDQFRIFNSNFWGETKFNYCEFDYVRFQDVLFNKRVEFKNSIFKSMPVFALVTIKDTIDFRGCNFQGGVDLRRINFDSAKAILLENCVFQNGSLELYWEQVKGKEKPVISLENISDIKSDDYKRIETIYKKLRDNYLIQGDKNSADDVMYELEWQREIYLGEPSQILYGIVFGYGYEPWRYIIFIVFPFIIIFSAIWYLFYYEIVLKIVNRDIEKDLELNPNYKVQIKKKEKKFFNFITFKFLSHSTISPHINFLERIWHCLFFSSSVLLGLRFKKEWIKTSTKDIFGQKTFLLIVTTEWILGLGLILFFVLFVKGTKFEFIKGIFGF